MTRKAHQVLTSPQAIQPEEKPTFSGGKGWIGSAPLLHILCHPDWQVIEIYRRQALWDIT